MEVANNYYGIMLGFVKIMDWGIFLGALAIAVAIFFGLRETSKQLSDIKEKVIVMEEVVRNVWDVIRRSPIFSGSATVERTLVNLGKVKISAEPHLEGTIYFIQTEKPIWDGALVMKVSKDTGLEEKGNQMFGKPLVVASLKPTLLRIEIPCTKASECTEYISIFLKWADSTYFNLAPKVSEFEEPISL